MAAGHERQKTNRTPQARRHKQNVIRIQINKDMEDIPHKHTHIWVTLWLLGIETNATAQGVPINFSPNTLAIGATATATAVCGWVVPVAQAQKGREMTNRGIV